MPSANPPSGATIAWESIRPQPDPKASFEEVCAQLLRLESHAADAVFQRQGLNDKGCEALWRSASAGDVAIQAKFFRHSLTNSEFGQLDASVKTALASFPDLVRYIVCLPTRLSDSGGERGGRKLKTARDRWNDHRAKWLGWAQTRARPVDFVLWDEHELQVRIQHDAGLRFYWFGDPQLTPQWAREQFQSTLDRVQKRYTPKLNVQLPISRAADSLLRSDRFVDEVFRVFRDADNTVRHINSEAFPEGSARESVATVCEETLKAIRQLLPLEEDRYADVDWSAIDSASTGCARVLQRSYAELPIPPRYHEHYGPYDETGYRVRAASRALRKLATFARSPDAQLAANPLMILIGNAGTGKTHFLCDVVERALQDGQFALMMLAEQFDQSDPLSQIIRFSGLSCSADEFLGALASLALATGRGRSVLIIDALNEEPGDRFWLRNLAKLMRHVEKHPHVGLIVSLRTDHQDTLLDDVIRDIGVMVEHNGFSYKLFEAQRIYFAEYKIQPPGPLLAREYENPLYLKILCDTLTAEELHHIPAGHRSIIELFNRFIAAVGTRIAIKLSEDPHGNTALRAIHALADAYAASGVRLMAFETAQQIVNDQQQFKAVTYDGSLFRQLLSENILAETTNNAGERVVRFMFERIADHAIAARLIDNAIATNGNTSALENEALRAALNPTFETGFETNTLSALVLQIPERLGVEIADSPAGKYARDLALDTLSSRSPLSITPRTAAIVSEALAELAAVEQDWGDSSVSRLLDNIIALATIPGHPLDATFLHKHLIAMTLARRDAFWTICVNYADPDHTLNRILAWSRTTPLAPLDPATKIGLATVLCWMTASSNRVRRDHATKVLAQLMTGAPSVVKELLVAFRHCNDPYVVERLLCAVYGGALMTPDPSARLDFARAVYATVFEPKNVPIHILSREYARLTVQLAVDDGLLDVDPMTFMPPYGAKPASLPRRDSLDWRGLGSVRDDIDEAVSYVRHSLGASGDFARYIVGTNSHTFPFIDSRLASPPPVSRAMAERMFSDSLDSSQRKLKRASHFDYWNPSRSKSEETRALAAARKAEKRFNESLSNKQHRLRKLAKSAEVSPARVDLKGVCNWLYARVKALGLGTESLGDHERRPGRGAYGNDEAQDVERIGKKYQWVAYYELLARYADNFWMQSARWNPDGNYTRLDTTAAIGLRNIDPTIFSPLGPANATNAWWVGEAYESWPGLSDLATWLRDENLPKPETLLRVSDDSGQRWLCLDTIAKWAQPTSRLIGEYDEPRGQIIYHLGAFLVKAADADAIEKSFIHRPRREMPRIEEVSATDTFLQELPAAYFARQSFPIGKIFEEVGGKGLLPAALHFRGLDRDAAAEEFATIAPSPLLVQTLRLGENAANTWRDSSGITAFDPSNGSVNGPPALLVREDVIARLDRSYELCWVLSGENRVIGGMGSFPMPGRIEVAGFWRLKSQRLPVGTYRFNWVAWGGPVNRVLKKQPAQSKR